MNLLEDALESVLKEDGFATLALVSTGEDLREWTYYAKSEDEFMADSITRLPECQHSRSRWKWDANSHPTSISRSNMSETTRPTGVES